MVHKTEWHPRRSSSVETPRNTLTLLSDRGRRVFPSWEPLPRASSLSGKKFVKENPSSVGDVVFWGDSLQKERIKIGKRVVLPSEEKISKTIRPSLFPGHTNRSVFTGWTNM